MEFIAAFRHSRHGTPHDLTTLKEEQSLIKDQNMVAQMFNKYFHYITRDLIARKHDAFKEQSHVSRIAN